MTLSAECLSAGAIGLVSGVLSGMFGIGGGIVTTPAIRLLMHAPALVAVGTPLPVILPSALTGSWSYWRRGMADFRAGAIIGIAGAGTAVAGAWATRFVGGEVVLLGTAAIIVWAALDMVLQVMRPPTTKASAGGANPDAPTLSLIGIGVLTGFYSGFLGLGGGFVLVPMLARWARFPIKRAIGTSLVAVALLAVPGTITHAMLGHVDWAIAASLTAGVIPGALLGARVNAGTSEGSVRIGFAVVLVIAAVWLAASELGGLL